ncbi:MAG TPA: exopolysaccharide biosynthesis protein [Verrucomicrobiota bacterium]|nr:protein exod [Verrucomicrobiales bacterium]HRI16370.1 exopolysaccharide biosynthesis protein [Verrucomicrobiota bacterium]
MNAAPAREPAVPTAADGPRAGFVPLSNQLLVLVNDHTGHLTLNELLARTVDRGPYGLIILLCLPFMAPVSLPGVSNVFGVVIVLLAWRIFHAQPARLPRGIGDRSVEGKILAKVIRASIRVLRFIERFTRPRGPAWLRSVAGRRFNAAVLIVGGLLLAAPIPPIIPLSNFAPAVGIILVAAAMMEEDGVVIWFGYAATLVALVYVAVLFVIQYALIVKLWSRFSDPVIGFFRGLFS